MNIKLVTVSSNEISQRPIRLGPAAPPGRRPWRTMAPRLPSSPSEEVQIRQRKTRISTRRYSLTAPVRLVT
jgi:hypothetical protein